MQSQESPPAGLAPLSLRKVLIAPFVVLIVAATAVIGWLSYDAGRDAVDTVAEHLLLETVARIGQAVERHVVGSRAVLEAAFPDGMSAPDSIEGDLAALRTRLWIATSLHTDPNNYVYYGNQAGQFYGVYRLAADDAELRVKLQAGERRRFSRISGIAGPERFMSVEPRVFDPRERPWYKAAESASSHTWTAVYIDFRTRELVATRARIVRSAQGRMQGVVATDVSLRALNDFVGRLRLSPHGFAFIVEPNGELIASSAGPNTTQLADGRVDRLKALETGDPQIEVAYTELLRALSEKPKPRLPQTRVFRGRDGQPVYVAFASVKDDAGLDWLTVVGVPQRDFTGRIADNVQLTAALALLAALIAGVIGAMFYAWVAKDLRKLGAAARRIGGGDLDAPVNVVRRDEIGELARSFEAMQARLRTDPLTGLANRDLIIRRINRLVQRLRSDGAPQAMGILFIDLDGFKRINDTYGHEAGDRVLVDVAARLKACVREGDVVARYAGDEFVVLLPELPDRATAERVRTSVEQALRREATHDAQVSGGEPPLRFGGSVGLAVFPGDAEDADSLIEHADRDMYARKEAARDGPPPR